MIQYLFLESTNRRGVPPLVRSAKWLLLAAVLAPVAVLIEVPVALYLLTLTLMLFRSPALPVFPVERIAFFILVFVIVLRGLALRQSLRFVDGVAWPMAGLSLLAILSAVSHPYDATTWSEVGTKFIIPFSFFWLSGLIFTEERSLQWLERFSFLVLAYLTITAVVFLAGIHDLVFPSFILDDSLGIHADRARGPFLQAVANGVSLTLLGLLAMERYRRGALRGWGAASVLVGLPLAILATKTRGVWLAFAIAVLLLLSRFRPGRWRTAALVLTFAGIIMAVASTRLCGEFGDRLSESGPVDFRMEAYVSGWEMFLERPLTGWNNSQLELASRIRGFRADAVAVHNTYLDVLLEHGLVGFGLYAWLVVALFRLSRRNAADRPDIGSLRSVWPLLLGVYLVNASFVVMNYPFVNGILFTYAGILAASPPCRAKPAEDAFRYPQFATTPATRGSVPLA